MRTLTVTRWTGPPVPDRPSTRGRWIWTLSGLATVGLLASPVVGLISQRGERRSRGVRHRHADRDEDGHRHPAGHQPERRELRSADPGHGRARPPHHGHRGDQLPRPRAGASRDRRRVRSQAHPGRPGLRDQRLQRRVHRDRAAGRSPSPPRAITAASPCRAWRARTWTPAAARCRPATSTDRSASPRKTAGSRSPTCRPRAGRASTPAAAPSRPATSTDRSPSPRKTAGSRSPTSPPPG